MTHPLNQPAPPTHHRGPAPGRPVPAHGSEGRYKGTSTRPGCRCTTCIRGNRLAGIRRARTRQQTGSNRIDNTILVAHIETLTASGMSYSVIARHADVAHATIGGIMAGHTQATQRARALRILAVHPARFDADSFHPALGYVRRVRALYAAGHNHSTIAAAAGLDRSTVSALAAGTRSIVWPRVASGVAAAYDTLSASDGTSSRSRSRAERNGWAGPAYWDEDTIDDPNFEPAVSDALTSHQRARLNAEEIQHLASCGVSEHEIAARVGRDPAYVRQQIAGKRGPGWRQHNNALAA